MPDSDATVTIPDVELVRVGTWAASTGVTTITTAHLEAMIAAHANTEVDRPPVKLGHTGALSDLGDSAPALGWVTNLRLADDGQTLVGDLVDVPASMQEAILAGYKRRSVEIAWGVTTPSGQTYDAALVGLALLGVQPPAVKGLADIAALYRPPAKTAASGFEATSVSALAVWDVTPGEPTFADRVQDEVRYAKQAAASLAALTGDLQGLQAVFDALDTMAARAGITDSRRTAAAAADDDGDADATEPGGPMTDELTAKVRKALQLPDDADSDAILATLSELQTKVDQARASADNSSDGGDGSPAGQDTTAASAGEPKVVTLSAGQYEELRRQAADGAEARTILRRQEIDSVIDTALSAGKFTAAEAPEYRTLLETNFDAGKQLIDKLAAGKVPTSALGADTPGPTAGQVTQADIDKALDAWLGEEV